MKHDKALEVVRKFCDASVFGDMEAVSETLHKKVIFLAPDLSSTLVGKEACMHSINQYHKEAKTLEFDIKDLIISQDHRDLITKVTYEVKYNYQGQLHHEQVMRLSSSPKQIIVGQSSGVALSGCRRRPEYD